MGPLSQITTATSVPHHVGHKTEECRQHKEEIESVIKRSYLGKYIWREDRPPQRDDRPPRREKTLDQQVDNGPDKHEIHVIAGGPMSGGDSNRSRRNYARRIHQVERQPPPRIAPYLVTSTRTRSEEPITFSDEDLIGVKTPHTDALVVTATINECNVRRVLVDNGSAADLLSYDCFSLMGLRDDQLQPFRTPLFGFAGVSIQSAGCITLPITLGTAPRRVTKVINFLVIHDMLGYNAIIGRSLIGQFRAVPSSFHQKMKFPTPHGVGEVLGNQDESRRCNLIFAKGKQKEVDQLPPPQQSV